MKKLILALMLLGTMSGNAWALSSEQRSGENTDGSSKFTDPDDQMPAFVTPQAQFQGRSDYQQMQMQAAPLTPYSPGEYDQGASAFQRAYSHQSR